MVRNAVFTTAISNIEYRIKNLALTTTVAAVMSNRVLIIGYQRSVSHTTEVREPAKRFTSWETRGHSASVSVRWFG